MTTTTDLSAADRILAALGHAFGWLGALIIWLAFGGRSRYIRFQAAQALLFSMAVFIAQLAVVVCLAVLFLAGASLGANPEPAMADTATASVTGLLYATLSLAGLGAAVPAVAGLSAFALVVRLLAGVICLFGGVFRYPILHHLAGRYT